MENLDCQFWTRVYDKFRKSNQPFLCLASAEFDFIWANRADFVESLFGEARLFLENNNPKNLYSVSDKPILFCTAGNGMDRAQKHRARRKIRLVFLRHMIKITTAHDSPSKRI